MKEKTVAVFYEGKEVNVNKEKFENSIIKNWSCNYLKLTDEEKYYFVFINRYGDYEIEHFKYEQDDTDRLVFSFLPCYKTKEECEKYVEIHDDLRSKALGTYEINLEKKDYCSFYIDFEDSCVCYNDTCKCHSGEQYFFEDSNDVQYFIDKYTYEEFIKYVYCLKGMF